VTGEKERERIARHLGDLARMGRLAAGIVSKGQEAYLEDSLDGQILRAAGREQVVEVATVVERLPDSFKAQFPAIEWVKIQRMRTMVAHADAGPMQDDFVWETLRTRIPELLRDLGVDGA
jgi:uncharacterized protein with HEPN domain